MRKAAEVAGKGKKGAFGHFGQRGQARLVDVSGKDVTWRQAEAGGRIRMNPAAARLLKSGKAKGDALAAARIAGIMAAKRVKEIIPLCHSLNLESAGVDIFAVRGGVEVRAWAKSWGKTGVEMEAMTAASVALLTVYDMCKSADRGMSIGPVRLLSKSGGKSGTYRRPSRGKR